MKENKAAFLRKLPKVSDFIESDEGGSLCREFGSGATKSELRLLLEDLRRRIRREGLKTIPDLSGLAQSLRQRLLRLTMSEGRRIVNATGIILHTGLGRAPLSKTAIEAVSCLGRFSPLQMDLATGERSLREEAIERMLVEITGCEAATIVNNNAAATMIILNTLAEGREVIISRGQLIEIGGSFRMPEVMSQSGSVLREVGTTNRTTIPDYQRALTQASGAIVHVHTSNYRVEGFSETPSIQELCELGRSHGLPVIEDLGSGALVPFDEFGLKGEPVAGDSIRAGCDVVCFSGDKLLGGPQAGLILGRKDIIERIRSNPFARMFRTGKMTLAAMEATLLLYLNGTFREEIPHFRMLSTPMEELRERASTLAGRLSDIKGVSATSEDGLAFLGGGSVPGQGIPSKIVRLGQNILPVDKLAAKLRLNIPAIAGRTNQNTLLFDMRTLMEGDIELIAEGVADVLLSEREKPG